MAKIPIRIEIRALTWPLNRLYQEILSLFPVTRPVLSSEHTESDRASLFQHFTVCDEPKRYRNRSQCSVLQQPGAEVKRGWRSRQQREGGVWEPVCYFSSPLRADGARLVWIRQDLCREAVEELRKH